MINMMMTTFSPCSCRASLALISSSVARFWNLVNNDRTSGDDVNILVVVVMVILVILVMILVVMMSDPPLLGFGEKRNLW